MTTPAQILDLANWKITLPIGAAESPDEHSADELTRGDTWPPFYRADETDQSVVFRAPVNGVTTSGSGYPRSELREMTGAFKAKWGGNDGYAHFMLVELAFTALPVGKPHVVGAQIHGATDDFCVFRLEGKALWLTLGDNSNFRLARQNYQLGDKIQCAFVVNNGHCLVYLDGAKIADLDASKLSGAYFKTGCYTQAKTGQSGVPGVSSNYGEVRVYRLKVSHGAIPSEVRFPASEPTQPPVPPPPVVYPKPQAKRVVMVIRHGEKPADKNDHTLNSVGRARAEALAGLFSPSSGVLRAGLYRPDRLIASKGTTASMRPLQTLQPLQLRTGLPLNTRYDFEAQEAEVGRWLAQRLDVTLVCGEHSALVAVCQALGKVSPKLPKAWDSKRFDVVWIFESDDGVSWKFSQVPELLLAGDRVSGIS
jgi:hypothetical protein